MPLDIGTGTTNTPDIRIKFGDDPSGANVTSSMIAYIPIVPFFAIKEADVSERSDATATKVSAGLILSAFPYVDSVSCSAPRAKSTAAFSWICKKRPLLGNDT